MFVHEVKKRKYISEQNDDEDVERVVLLIIYLKTLLNLFKCLLF